MNYAPVLIPTLNRYNHLKNCMESLLRNNHSDKTHLYIALDAPLKEEHKEGYYKIKKYLDSISGFKELTIIKRKCNFGPFENIKNARKEIFKNYDRIILSEDDNIFSKNFLDYINKGLTKYEHKKEVFAICGYNYPVDIPQSYNANIYMWKGFSGWGYGVLREKFNEVSFSIDEVNDFLKKLNNIRKLNKYAGHYLPALLNITRTNHITGDTVICMHLIKNNMYSVFPVVSKVRNLGHDGTGVHCGFSNNFCNQIIDKNISFSFDDIPEREYYNKTINKKLKEYFRLSLKGNIKTLLRYLQFVVKNS